MNLLLSSTSYFPLMSYCLYSPAKKLRRWSMRAGFLGISVQESCRHLTGVQRRKCSCASRGITHGHAAIHSPKGRGQLGSVGNGSVFSDQLTPTGLWGESTLLGMALMQKTLSCSRWNRASSVSHTHPWHGLRSQTESLCNTQGTKGIPEAASTRSHWSKGLLSKIQAPFCA